MAYAICVNSGTQYASLPLLASAEAGLHSGAVTVQVSGEITGDATFAVADFDSVFITAVSGEEFDPSTLTGARHNGKLSATCDLTIDKLSVEEIAAVYPSLTIDDSDVKALGINGITYGGSNTVHIRNTIIRGTYRGTYATGQNPNATIENCTLVDNSNLGLLRCNCINTVVVNCGNTAYFNTVSQSNTWAEDASGLNTVTEGTDIFVDYAGGDYRIRSDSEVGVAGAGAFIQESLSDSITPTSISQTVTIVEPSLVAGYTLSPNMLMQAAELDPTLVSVTIPLSPDPLTHAVTLAESSLDVGFTVTVDNVQHSTTLDSVTDLDILFTIEPEAIHQLSKVGDATAGEIVNIQIDDIIQYISITDVTYTPIEMFLVDGIAQEQGVSVPSLVTTLHLDPHDLNQGVRVGVATMGDIPKLTSFTISYKPNDVSLSYKPNDISVSYKH